MFEPLKPEQIQEMVRSGKMRVVSAPRKETERYANEMREVLLVIAPYMCLGEDPESWVDTCYVTDRSCLSDFFFRFGGLTPEVLKQLSEKLGFEVSRDDYLVDIAAKIRGVQ